MKRKIKPLEFLSLLDSLYHISDLIQRNMKNVDHTKRRERGWKVDETKREKDGVRMEPMKMVVCGRQGTGGNYRSLCQREQHRKHPPPPHPPLSRAAVWIHFTDEDNKEDSTVPMKIIQPAGLWTDSLAFQKFLRNMLIWSWCCMCAFCVHIVVPTEWMKIIRRVWSHNIRGFHRLAISSQNWNNFTSVMFFLSCQVRLQLYGPRNQVMTA